MSTLPANVVLPPTNNLGSLRQRIERKHLIAVGLIFLSLLSLALLIVTIVQAKNLSQKVNNNNPDSTYGYCLNRGCLSASTHQSRFMDNAALADRCTDFYKYACGTWQKTHLIQSFEVERTILGDINNRREEDIERLLNSPVSRPSTNSWEWKVKTYYKECIDDYARLPDSGKAMVDLMKDPDTIDGWFLFDNTFENSSQEFLLKNQTIYQQISHIHGDLGATVGFGLRVRFDDADPNIKRLEFFSAGLTMEVNDYLGSDSFYEGRRSAYKTYILEVLTFLAQDADITDGNLSDRLFTIASDIIEIETKIAEYMQLSKDNGDKPILITLIEMSERYSFDFIELMSHEIGDPSVVSDTTSVYVTSPTYFQSLFSFFLKNTEPIFARTFHNYMRWRLVRTYIEDLSYKYLHAHRVFLNKYTGHILHSTNEAYCAREVMRRFPLGIQRLYTMDSPVESDSVELIGNMFNSLKDSFKQYIDEQATWMSDEATKTFAKQKIDALTGTIGYAGIAANDLLLDQYYDRFVVGDKSHFENSYGYHRFYGWTMLNSLINPDQLDHWDYFETRTNRLFDYIHIFNRLFVIASAMHEPLINVEWPWAMNIGSLGVLLAERLFSSIDGPEGRVHSATGTRIPDWWSSTTGNAYNISRKCITDYYVNEVKSLEYNINGAEILVNLLGEPFSPTTLRHIGAIRFAYSTFKKLDDMKSSKMPNTNLTSAQTFFLAYAQTQCYQRQELLQLLRTQLGFYDERTALNAALIHMPEFAEAFQCKPKENQCF